MSIFYYTQKSHFYSNRVSEDLKMDSQQLKRCLQSIGKECFVKYFSHFSDFTLSSKELVDYLKKQEEYTENGSRTRVSQSRRIINSGHSKQVLLEICNSSRIPEENNYSC